VAEDYESRAQGATDEANDDPAIRSFPRDYSATSFLPPSGTLFCQASRMRRMSRKARIGAFVASAFVLVAVLGSAALAMLPAAEEFAPFTMRITWWTAAAVQRQGLPPEPGTAVSLLEYRSSRSWKLTVLSFWDPSVVGTTNEVNQGTHSVFLAQVQRLMGRVIPEDEGPMAPLRWLIPGLIDLLPQQGFFRSASSPTGTLTLIERDARAVPRPDGTTGVLNGTVVVFDVASRLPLSVRTYASGVLRESYEFEVVSRP
jgi:hypothetical protein